MNQYLYADCSSTLVDIMYILNIHEFSIGQHQIFLGRKGFCSDNMYVFQRPTAKAPDLRLLDVHYVDFYPYIHPASRGVAAHTAGLFRSVRGAKGGFPPWGLPKLRIFTFPPVGLPKLGNFHFSPPWGLPKLEFSLFPPVGLPKLGNFHFSPPWGLPKLGNFHFSPPWAPQAREFSLSPPWGLPKLGNFHFSPVGSPS